MKVTKQWKQNYHCVWKNCTTNPFLAWSSFWHVANSRLTETCASKIVVICPIGVALRRFYNRFTNGVFRSWIHAHSFLCFYYTLLRDRSLLSNLYPDNYSRNRISGCKYVPSYVCFVFEDFISVILFLNSRHFASEMFNEEWRFAWKKVWSRRLIFIIDILLRVEKSASPVSSIIILEIYEVMNVTLFHLFSLKYL